MSSTDSQRRQSRVPFAVWIFLGAFLVRLLVLIKFSSSAHFLPNYGDMKFYNDWALRILNGEWTDHKAFYGLPGYPFFLAGIYSLTGYSPFIVGMLQAAAEAGTAALLFEIARQIFPPSPETPPADRVVARRGEIIGMLAALGWVFFQPAQAFSAILMPTCWLVLVFWGCVLVVLKTRSFSIWRPWLWMGLLIGALTVMIATVLFLIPLIVTAIILKSGTGRPWKARLGGIAAACALLIGGVFVGASPCWLHNYFVAGESVMLSAHSGVNFYIGNNALANGYPKIPPGLRAGQEGMLKDSITMAELASGRKLKRAEVSRFWSEKANAYIHGHFGDWLKLMGVKFKNFWNSFQYDDLSLISLFDEDGVISPGLRFGFVAALAIPGIFVGAWKYPRSRWVVAAVLLHMGALMPVFITERYRLAAAPGLILMAIIGLWELWDLLVSAQWGNAAIYVTVAAMSVLFVAQPPDDVGLWSLDYYNTGIKSTELGNLKTAQQDLDIAFAYVPENSEINFALGNVWLQKKERTIAKKFYRRAIEINGRHSGAYNNLGVLALEEKRWQIAETFFSRSLAIEPEDVKTHYLLARVKLELGKLPEAQKEIEIALKSKPDQVEFQALEQEIRTRQDAKK